MLRSPSVAIRTLHRHARPAAAGGVCACLAGGCLLLGGGRAAAPAACGVESVRREALRTPQGDMLYVEPSTLTASGGDLLLAGTPNYVIRPPPPGSDGEASVAANTLFGVILRPDGAVVPVPAPLPAHRIAGVRAAPRAAGGWHVVFTEGETPDMTGLADPASRIWYGVLRDTVWSPLEPLPLPAGHEVRTLLISSLVQRGDSLAVAAMARYGEEPAARVAVFARRGRGWEGTVVPGLNPAYVEPVWLPGRALQLVVVRADDTLARDENSLLLYAVHPEWRRVRRIAGGQGRSAHAPRFIAVPKGHLLARVEAEGGVGGRSRATLWTFDETRPAVEIDSLALHASLEVGPGGSLVVVIDHVPDDDAAREVRLYGVEGGNVGLIGSFRHPFAGFFASAFLSPAELVVAGPVRVPVGAGVGAGEGVASHLLRATLRCERG